MHHLVITAIILLSLSISSCAVSSKVFDLNEAIDSLGQIARESIPEDKPGRLRGYLLPVGKDLDKATDDLIEALYLERGRSGYFALLSYDSENLVVASKKAFPKIGNHCFQKLTIIFVGESQYEQIVEDVISHTGANYIFKEIKP